MFASFAKKMIFIFLDILNMAILETFKPLVHGYMSTVTLAGLYTVFVCDRLVGLMQMGTD